MESHVTARTVRTTLVHGPGCLDYAEVRGHNAWKETGLIIDIEKDERMR